MLLVLCSSFRPSFEYLFYFNQLLMQIKERGVWEGYRVWHLHSFADLRIAVWLIGCGIVYILELVCARNFLKLYCDEGVITYLVKALLHVRKLNSMMLQCAYGMLHLYKGDM